MNIGNLSVFLLASIVLILTPGPDMIYVAVRSLSQGRKAGVISACGVVTGILVHTIAAALGLSAILATSAIAFTGVKYCGAAYLIYLGIKAILSKDSFTLREDSQKLAARQLYLQGFLTNVLNPKVAIFFLAFLPQFVHSESSAALQMLSLGLLFAFMGQLFLTMWAVVAAQSRRWIARTPKLADFLKWLTGSVMIGLGLRLAVAEQD